MSNSRKVIAGPNLYRANYRLRALVGKGGTIEEATRLIIAKDMITAAKEISDYNVVWFEILEIEKDISMVVLNE